MSFCCFLTWICTLDDSESGSASTIGITVAVVGVVSVLFGVLYNSLSIIAHIVEVA